MKCFLKYGLLFLLAALISERVRGQETGDYLSYQIPRNAVKVGPANTRNYNEQVYNYFLPGSEQVTSNIIGRETYLGDALIERQLFKDGAKHGVQRKWHPDGSQAQESPYKNGQMHGVFNHWNEKKQMVGSYEIWDGKGIKRLYNENGKLIWDQQIENSVGNGLLMEVTKINKFRSIVTQKNGNNIGTSYSFYPNGELYSVGIFSQEGVANGPYVEFAKSGEVLSTSWFINGRKVSEEEYAAAAAKDSTLPPYYFDKQRYKNLVAGEAKALLKKYSEMPPVEIPLQQHETALTDKASEQAGQQQTTALQPLQPKPQSQSFTAQEKTEATEQQPATFTWLWIGAIVAIAGVVAFLVLQRQRA